MLAVIPQTENLLDILPASFSEAYSKPWRVCRMGSTKDLKTSAPDFCIIGVPRR